MSSRGNVIVDKNGIVSSPFPALSLKYDCIYDNLHDKFRECYSKTALLETEGDTSLTYEQLGKQVARTAYHLSRHGVKDTHTVAFYLPNCVASVVLQLAVWRLGATVCCISPLSKPNELATYMKTAHCDYLVTGGERTETSLTITDSAKIKKVFSLTPHPRCVSYIELLADVPRGQESPITPKRGLDDVICILFSSGTTGIPKAVMLSNRYFIYSWIIPAMTADFFQSSVVVYQPFAHLYGIGNWMAGLVYGLTVYVMTSFHLEGYLKAVQDGKVTHLQLVPPVMVMIAKSPLLHKYDWSHVRSIVVGAAPSTAELEALMKERIGPSVFLKQAYGLTEGGVLNAGPNPINTGIDPSPIGSVGYPAPNVKTKITDINTGATLKAYEQGELCAQGNHFMDGYLGNPKDTAAAMDKEGWLHTGDIAYYDKNGNFFIVDRLKELIKYKGMQVSPSELEGLLLSHPDIDDVGVTSIPEELAGELPQAWVVLKPGHRQTAEQIQKFVTDRVAPYKQLRGGVLFVDAIPKSANGKILHREMKDKAWASVKKSKL